MELTAALRTLNGTPAEVLEHRELLELMLPILRADFNVSETYACSAAEPLACPMSVLVGTNDPEAGPTEAWAWARETREPLAVHVFEGDHFYLRAHLPAVHQLIVAQLSDPQRAR